jgi:GntR family transcriptional regulator
VPPNAPAGAGRPPAFVTDEVPLYYQLAGILREKILSAQFAVGERIPTEAELVREYGVSRITVRQALSALEKEGLIRREAGRGTFVTEHGAFTGTMRMEGSFQDLMALGLATEVRLVDLRTVRATPAECEALALPAGSSLVRATRVRHHHHEPYSYLVNDLPFEIGRRISRADWKGSILRALESRLGIPLREAEQSVRASLADATQARLLGTRIGAPLLAVDRLVFTNNRRPVERVRVFYRSDIYSFTVHLAREGTHPEPHVGWALRDRRRR